MAVSTAAMAISEPTGRRDAGYLYQPAPTLMPEMHELEKLQKQLLHLGKRQETSSVNTYTIVTSPDETCGFLSGSPGNAIKCANGEKCSWELAYITRIMCGSMAHVTCYNREQALNTELCNDVCQSNSFYLLCTERSSAYCAVYSYEDGVKDYRCATASLSKAQGVSFTYDGQRGRELKTTTVAEDFGAPTTSLTTEEPEESETETETSTESEDITTTITVDPARTTSAAPVETDGKKDGPNIGAIVGGSIGGFVALSLIVLGAIWLFRRNKNNQTPPNQPAPAPPAMQQHTPVASVPPMSEHTGLVSPASPTQSDWRGSSVAPTSTQSPVSMQGWSTHSPASQPYNAAPQNPNYH
ncbi:hypothetical protein BHE90_015170 [Fusarium euwallaceae]|uniref:Uncharacterized protein n=5 Tax=Fusarium solani species complex TaxID=232080 RepID=A0A3M2RAY4_9HYPO|nr:hypothetical protein CDV36_015271 [Fusarium kuroshium]RSL41273.1 hypothetical protein CEP53_012862 [Fusarium sp. AF-6]RSL66707.1 hypothetical protein CEP51_012760 [Fusarium floridanum]RSL91458.1 hypothetical protein CDV31_015450 [Fusarium ambrosium]RSL91924.1 hypothetical protein CEP52_014113 [Fusarium oligoseptatum]RTE70444.1 hypothetical protein BHE90_015170 [Fusarium euwallaceae]